MQSQYEDCSNLFNLEMYGGFLCDLCLLSSSLLPLLLQVYHSPMNSRQCLQSKRVNYGPQKAEMGICVFFSEFHFLSNCDSRVCKCHFLQFSEKIPFSRIVVSAFSGPVSVVAVAFHVIFKKWLDLCQPVIFKEFWLHFTQTCL